MTNSPTNYRQTRRNQERTTLILVIVILAVVGHVRFFNERLGFTVDGQVQPGKKTVWSKQTPSQAASDR